MKIFFILFSFFTFFLHAKPCDSAKYDIFSALYFLNTIEDFDDNYIKINRDKIFIRDNSILLNLLPNVNIEIPRVNIENGNFLLEWEQMREICTEILDLPDHQVSVCAKREVRENNSNKSSSDEAKQHYDAARNHGLAFLGHSLGAAATFVDMPPLSALEIYNAVISLKEMSNEYLKGWDKEHSNLKNTLNEKEDKKNKGKDKDFDVNANYHSIRSDLTDHLDNLSSGSENNPYERHD